ncbi:hypothetical protein [Winogradskyella sp. HaHa_3_26]|uniref:hypothetical protein n=2 Tax=Winogradskyella TaxID=286104 RepID=UPI001C4F720F|nr:hypothetical protein [Winogradskyella sp. HaHa_3_26]QXP79019.1 hypothetical protein H0I32_17770 [Winogradskyella sp. HaHa_3_26]
MKKGILNMKFTPSQLMEVSRKLETKAALDYTAHETLNKAHVNLKGIQMAFEATKFQIELINANIH